MNSHGYVDCACRDCFEIAVCSAALGESHKFEDHLCGVCTEAGCEPNEECQRQDAYDMDAESDDDSESDGA